jgi:hypothetical protein
MKAIFTLILFISLDLSSYAQSEFKITDTLNVNEINKEEVFESWLEWVATNFKSTNNVIQYQNKDKGKMILKGILADEFRTEFTLSLSITEIGWFYTFTNIKSLQYNYDYVKGESECYTKQCRTNIKKWKEKTTENLQLIIKSISTQ